MKRFYLLITLFSVLMLLSCYDEDTEATVPAYIKINDINVTIEPSREEIEGSASDKITDAWVFINDQLIGAYELPTIVPILQTGPVTVRVRGGIFNNGLSNQRVIYPFYEFYDLETTLVPEVIYEPTINVKYKVDSKFIRNQFGQQDFERGNSFDNNPNSDSNLVVVEKFNFPDKVLYGNRCGGLFLPPGTTFGEIYTPTLTDIPRIGSAVYMELDYRTTHDFAVSVYTNNRDQQFSVVNFRPSSEWNKVYIDFSKVFSTLFDAVDYNIAIGMVKPSEDNAELLIDNVKLIQF